MCLEGHLISANIHYLFWFSQIEYLRSTILWVILKEPYWCAIIAFALNTGAYT